jgi:hypothetical protein
MKLGGRQPFFGLADGDWRQQMRRIRLLSLGRTNAEQQNWGKVAESGRDSMTRPCGCLPLSSLVEDIADHGGPPWVRESVQNYGAEVSLSCDRELGHGGTVV